MKKKLSRRDFARTSVAAGAAAVALPSALFGKTGKTASAKASTVARTSARVGARRVVPPPPNIAYGGDPSSATAVFRDSIAHADAAAAAAQETPVTVGDWTEGYTIPSEYYIGEPHYLSDERFIGEHLWFLADHVSRIPNPGDFFVFEYGRGDSVIILRDQAGAVKGYQNVCRHRGSRLCRHDEDPAPTDARLSVKQLASSGNTPVFRCPYHAWTYDLAGKLISAPNGMPADFDRAQNGLLPAHVRVAEGFIFVNFSRSEPPDFDTAVERFVTVAKEYNTADLKVVARTSAPTKANWKLVLENFQECYHCGPAHRNLVTTHPFWDGIMTPERRARLEREVERYLAPRSPSAGGGMSGGSYNDGNRLNVNFASGSLDGKTVAPLLPGRTEWTHQSRNTTSGWSTGYLQCYDDHVAAVRFTPRDVKSTDAEIFWLVRADARARDVKIDKMKALWEITYLEDRWITENNHQGIESGFYRSGRYAATETGPIRFITWYMTEVVGATERPSGV